MKLFRWSAVLAMLVVTISCRNDVQPDRLVAPGSYTLEAGTDGGPSIGTLFFLETGPVIRRIRYASPDGSQSAEYVTVGTFRVTGPNSIELSLRDVGSSATYVWTVTGTFEDGVITLGYPGPADGWIAERYRHD
jgi:hypothetical protein